jgi:PhnB protein
MTRNTIRRPDSRAALAPWLSVRDSVRTVDLYKSAFAAQETFRLEGGTGVVVRLSIGDSEFWVAEESPEHQNFSPETLNGGTVRLILCVDNSDAMFAQACAAGARSVSLVSEGHGWRVGRVVDPYGHHWEIGRQLTEPA